MTLPHSAAELEIRDAVVARFRKLWPTARIIHELNIDGGTTRADVAAVTVDRLILCEIKSERDTLDRLEAQCRSFYPTCHHLVVAAHEKWFAEPAPVRRKNGDIHYPPSAIAGMGAGATMWRYPGQGEWLIGRAVTPWPDRMLGLLWVDELKAECARHQAGLAGRSASRDLRGALMAQLLGPEIEAAVCRRLRSRPFTEADPQIREGAFS